METHTPITMVRLYLPEAGHSKRKAQMEKVLHLLRDQIHVHGVTVLTGIKEAAPGHEPHYENVSDLLRRNPDPPAIVEFFDETPAAAEIRRLLRRLVPDSYVVYWSAIWEIPVSEEPEVTAAMVGTQQQH
jgi:PII-like signaling protein